MLPICGCMLAALFAAVTCDNGHAGRVTMPAPKFDLRATPNEDSTRSAKVEVAGVKSALPDGATAVRAAAATCDGKYVFFVHGLGRYNLPATQLDRGWINTAALSVFDGATGKRINTVILDDPTRGAANPRGIAVNAKWIAVVHHGTHELSLIPKKAFFEKLLAYQGEATADLGFMRAVGRRRIALPEKFPLSVRFKSEDEYEITYAKYSDGEAAFNDASLCYQGWQSCASCHIDGKNDGLKWDFAGSGGGLGHPEETVDLSKLKSLSPTCVPNSFRDDHLYAAPPETVKATEAYIKEQAGIK